MLDVGFESIEVESLGIADFPDYSFKYNILELNTAVQPKFLEYLFETRSVSRIRGSSASSRRR